MLTSMAKMKSGNYYNEKERKNKPKHIQPVIVCTETYIVHINFDILLKFYSNFGQHSPYPLSKITQRRQESRLASKEIKLRRRAEQHVFITHSEAYHIKLLMK